MRRRPSFHVGIEWLAVGLCVAVVGVRRSLLVGLVLAAAIVAGARAGSRAAIACRAPPRRAPATSLRSRCGVGLDLDEQRRVDERGHDDRGRGGSDLAEDLAVDLRDRRDVAAVGHVHPRPDDVGQREAGLVQRPLDDLEDRPRLGGRVAGMAASGRPGRRRSCRRRTPSRPRPRRASSRSEPPRARRWRRGRPRSRRAVRLRRVRHDPTTGSRPTSSSSAASSAVRGTIESTSRYSSGEWSIPPIGPRPSIVGTPMPEVVFASEAPPVATSSRLEPEARGEGDDVVREPAGALELLDRRPAGASSRRRPSRRARRASRRARRSPPRPSCQRLARTSPGRRPGARPRRRRCSGACRP